MSEERQYVEKKNYIKFIDSHYKVLFYIPDGGGYGSPTPTGNSLIVCAAMLMSTIQSLAITISTSVNLPSVWSGSAQRINRWTTSKSQTFTPSIFLRQARMAPALPTVLSTQGRVTVLRLRLTERRGARDIASLNWRTMEAGAIALAVLSNGAVA